MDRLQVYSGVINLSDTVVVSDPCYTRDTWCMGILKGVKPGQYDAVIEYSNESDWGRRVAKVGVFLPGEKIVEYSIADFEVGVDSGQAGIFDNSIYPEGKDNGDYADKTSFYGKVCELTDDDKLQNGIYEGKGIVSRSGFGDGGYDCQIGMNAKGEIVYIDIEFIGSEEDDEEIPEKIKKGKIQ